MADTVVGSIIVKLLADLGGYSGNLQKAEGDLNKFTSGVAAMSQALGKAALGIGVVGGALTATFGVIAKQSVDQAAKIEALEAMFTGLTGSVDAAKDAVQLFVMLGEKSPYLGMEDFANAAKDLIIHGQASAETLEVLADAAAGVSANAEQAKGNFAGLTQTILSIQLGGPRAVMAMKRLSLEGFLTEDQFHDLAKRYKQGGRAAADAILGILEERFKGAEARAAKGLYGVLDDIQDGIERFKMEVGAVLIPVVEKVGRFIADLIQKFNGLPAPIRAAIIVIPLLVGVLLTLFATMLGGIAAVGALANAIITMTPAGWIAIAAIAALGLAFTALASSVITFVVIYTQGWDKCVLVTYTALTHIENMLIATRNFWLSIFVQIDEIMSGKRKGFDIDAATKAFDQSLGDTGKLIDDFSAKAQKSIDDLKKTFDAMGKAGKNAGDSGAGAVKKIGDSFTEFVPWRKMAGMPTEPGIGEEEFPVPEFKFPNYLEEAKSFGDALKEAFTGSIYTAEQWGQRIGQVLTSAIGQLSAAVSFNEQWKLSLQNVSDILRNILNSFIQIVIQQAILAGIKMMLNIGTAGAGAGVPGGIGMGASGGWVPGAIGQPVPMIVHGGELILNQTQQKEYLNPNVTINVHTRDPQTWVDTVIYPRIRTLQERER